MSLGNIAKQINDASEPIVLVFGFNATGKTRLSVAFKNHTKDPAGKHAGIYFNAFSEDLFFWDNDEGNSNAQMRLMVRASSLDEFHFAIDEAQVRNHLAAYLPSYDFIFGYTQGIARRGISHVTFYEEGGQVPIKISRGEERIFIWCFFLALFEVEAWSDVQSKHIFIDDPVSSLDDYNLFVTASSIYDIILDKSDSRKIVLTTHHFGLFMAVQNFLLRGEGSDRFKGRVLSRVLLDRGQGPQLRSFKKSPILAHLRALQMLQDEKRRGTLGPQHFVILRQTLETIASFLGSARVSHVLEQIGIGDAARTTQQINALSHKLVFQYEPEEIAEPDKQLMGSVLDALKAKYDFVTHV